MLLPAKRLALCTGLLTLLITVPAATCRETRTAAPTARAADWRTPANEAFLDSLQRRTFEWFWDLSDTRNGLTPDRWPTRSFVSVGAMGFSLTAYPIGAERGWVTRGAAAERVLATFRFLWTAPQDSTTSPTGYRGFFYHFLDPTTGRRFETVELSTVDTALLLGGVLFCQSYFDRATPEESQIRAYADSIADRVDWHWAAKRPPQISHGWGPENGHLEWDWIGYNEAMLLNVFALGSRTYPADASLWATWCKNYQWGTFEGQEHLGFPPLFGHQYSHLWIDFRGIQDPYMKAKGIDYFENSRRATLSQRAYAIRNPGGWTGYGADVWGLTACDGPKDTVMVVNGKSRQFRTYSARGASMQNIEDDGTLSPTAAGGSVAFAPEIVIPALRAMKDKYGDHVYRRYGFIDSFNPSLTSPMPVQHGHIVPNVGWFDDDYLGIDQGPIVCMIENLRTGLVWNTMKKNPHVIRGLKRAGFTGGWLDRARVSAK